MALIIVTASLIVYIVLRLAADAMGAIVGLEWLGFVFDIPATILLLVVMETMRSVGTIEFEVWGTPYEYVYREIQAKAILSDTTQEEDQPVEITNLILGSLDEVESLARDELRRRVAQVANRTVSIATDALLEPNDIIELQEEGEVARYLILEVSKTFERGASDPVYELTVYRVR